MKFQIKQITSYLTLILAVIFFIQGCNSSQEGTLSIEAGLVYRAGDVKPVARTQFYLLDDNLETILKNAQITQIDLWKDLTPIQHFAAIQRGKKVDLPVAWSDEAKNALKQTDEAVKSHIVGTMTTDFNGKGQFEHIKPGKYYLMGVGGTDKQAIVWNLPIEIKSGNQTVILDNNNSATTF
jgi:hypothetical protein